MVLTWRHSHVTQSGPSVGVPSRAGIPDSQQIVASQRLPPQPVQERLRTGVGSTQVPLHHPHITAGQAGGDVERPDTCASIRVATPMSVAATFHIERKRTLKRLALSLVSREMPHCVHATSLLTPTDILHSRKRRPNDLGGGGYFDGLVLLPTIL